METPPPSKRPAVINALVETFGFSPALATGVVLFLGLLTVLAAYWVIQSAPPDKIVLTSGPAGSTFHRWAEAYQKELAAQGVTLEIRPSGGSADNLNRLKAGEGVDIGFVAGGIPEGTNLRELVSLGSIAYQPLLLFYRSPAPIDRLAALSGKRIAVGAPGSGTRNLATTLLQANGVTPESATFSDLDAGAATTALAEGRLDAVFLMGDSAPIQILRTLVRSADIKLYHFRQADAYLRRYPYLNRIVLPEGSFDLAANLPAQTVTLVGPTVELVARKDFNSALIDLLLDEVARKVHGKAGLLQKQGEFPAPLQHEFQLSPDAVRFYKSGQGFLHQHLPFWLASLSSRILVAAIPLALLLIPVFRFLPVIYRLSIRLRLFKCYRPLMKLERDTVGELTPERIAELHQRLDGIEQTVNRLSVPASFADQFYELRLHIAYVRQRLNNAQVAAK